MVVVETKKRETANLKTQINQNVALMVVIEIKILVIVIKIRLTVEHANVALMDIVKIKKMEDA